MTLPNDSSPPAPGATQTESRAKTIAYWGTTGFVALIMISGGFFQVIHQQGATEALTSLGYPLYAVVMIGVWKMLGGIVILMPKTPRLKEWAYAGVFIDLTGAAISQGMSGGGVGHVVWPLGLAALAVASWALRPRSRVLGTLLPAPRSAA